MTDKFKRKMESRLSCLLHKIETLDVQPSRYVGMRGGVECYEPAMADGAKVEEIKRIAKNFRKAQAHLRAQKAKNPSQLKRFETLQYRELSYDIGHINGQWFGYIKGDRHAAANLHIKRSRTRIIEAMEDKIDSMYHYAEMYGEFPVELKLT